VTQTGQPLHYMMPNSQLDQYAAYQQRNNEIQHSDEYKNHALAAVSEALDKAEVDMLLGGRGQNRRASSSALDGLSSGGPLLANEEAAALGISRQHGNLDPQDGNTNFALQAAREALRAVDEPPLRKTGHPSQGRAPDVTDCGLKFDKPMNGHPVDSGLKFDKPMNGRARNRLTADSGSKGRTTELQEDTGLKFDKPATSRRRSRLSTEDAESNQTSGRTADVQEPGMKFDEPCRGRRRNLQAEDDGLKFDIPGRSHGRAQTNGSQQASCAEQGRPQHLGENEVAVTPALPLAATDVLASVEDEFATEPQQEARLSPPLHLESFTGTAEPDVGARELHRRLHEHAEPQQQSSLAVATKAEEAAGQALPQDLQQSERIFNHIEASEFVCDPVKLLEEEDDELEIMARQEMDADEPVPLFHRLLPPRPPSMETPRQPPVAPRQVPVAPPKPRQSSTGPPKQPLDAHPQAKRRVAKKARGESKERQKLVKRDFLVDSILKDEIPNKSATPSNARSRSHNLPRGILLPEMRSRSVPHYEEWSSSSSSRPSKSLTPRQRQQAEISTCPAKAGKADGVAYKSQKQGTSLLPQLDNLSKHERSQRALAASGSQSARTWKGKAAVSLYT